MGAKEIESAGPDRRAFAFARLGRLRAKHEGSNRGGTKRRRGEKVVVEVRIVPWNPGGATQTGTNKEKKGKKPTNEPPNGLETTSPAGHADGGVTNAVMQMELVSERE